MDDKKIITKATKRLKERKFVKKLKIALLIFLLVLLIVYFVVGLIYNNGNFSITLDRNLYLKNKIIVDFLWK